MNRRRFFSLGGTSTDANSESSPQNPLANPLVQDKAPGVGRITGVGLEPFAPSATNPWNYQKAAHLLRRSVIGVKDSEIRQAVTDGLDTTLAKLFTTFTPSYDRIKTWVGTEPQTRPPQGSKLGTPEYDTWQATMFLHRAESAKWWLQVFSTSPVSIQERMVLFWHNHFVSETDVVKFGEWMVEQNKLLRKHALGNFKTFAREISTDPAMLIYLDGAKNYKIGKTVQINENYGRELQELFTMGVTDRAGNANYTQSDVSEAARALSGWTIPTGTQGSFYSALTSKFESSRWDSGAKTFLGQTGAWNTDDVINIIFAQRGDQVAKYICEKIYKAFVYDVPDYTVVDAMADTFKKNNFEIKPVMEQLLKSAHFFDASNIGAIPKSPTDYIVGMIRSFDLKNVPDFNATLTARTANALSDKLDTLGQLVNNAPNVKGWAGGRTWVSTSTLPLRQQFVLDVMDAKLTIGNGANKQTIYQFDAVAFAKTFPNTSNLKQLTTDMAQFLLNVPPSTTEFTTLFETIVDGGKDYEWNINDAAQRPAERIKKFIKAAAQLAKIQLQ